MASDARQPPNVATTQRATASTTATAGTSDLDELKRDFLRMALDDQRTEYAEVWQDWRDLEAKIQATATAAGVLLGVVFAILQLSVGKVMAVPGSGIALVLGLILLAFLGCFRAMWVSGLALPERSAILQKMAADFIGRPDDELYDQYRLALQEQMRMWRYATSKVSVANQRKAVSLRWAQVLLATSLVLLAIISAWIGAQGGKQ